MSANFTDDGISVLVGMVRNCLCNISQKAPWFYFSKSQLYTFLSNFDQVCRIFGNFADAEHSGRIRKITVVDGGNIHIDNIAVF